MLYTIAAVFVILWLLGQILSFTFKGLIHILLGLAIVIVIYRLIAGGNPK